MDASLERIAGGKTFSIVYPNRVGADGVARDIMLFDELLQDGRRFTHSELWDASQSAEPGAPRGLSSVDTYQVLRLNFAERRNKAYGFLDDRVTAVRTLFDQSFLRSTTETTFNPLGKASVVRHLNLDGTVTEWAHEIPKGPERYNDAWSFLVLAPEQSPQQLGYVNEIPEELRPVVKAYFGEGYEEVGAVYQFHNSCRPNGNLREVRLFLPTAQNRDFTESFVGGVNIDDRFDLNPYINFGKPAFAGAQEISAGNEDYVQRPR